MDYVLLVALAIAVIGLGFLTAALAGRDRRDHRTARQLAAVERKLDVIIAHLGVEVPEPAHPAVVELLERGKKVAAIKAYREQTGADLVEAKTAVERMERGRSATAAPAATPVAPATATPAVPAAAAAAPAAATAVASVPAAPGAAEPAAPPPAAPPPAAPAVVEPAAPDTAVAPEAGSAQPKPGE